MATGDAAAPNDDRGDTGMAPDHEHHPIISNANATSPGQRGEGQDVDAGSDDGEVDGLSNDVVFQCGTCRSVVGDTLSDYEAHLESKTISLRAARSVDIEDNMKMSNTGFDAGCTYKPIRCSECRTHLGRVYGSTTPALDSRRCTYTFDTTALVSYQLGTCLTLDGKRISHQNQQRVDNSQNAHAEHQAVTVEVSSQAFDALHAHVGSLTDVTNKLSASFDDSCLEMKELIDANRGSITEMKSGLEHAQNMMLLWEERFRRLEACEQRIEQLTTSGQRATSFEGRVARLEAALGSYSSPSAQQTVHRTPARLKVSPSIRRPTASPARAAMRAAVSPARVAMRAAPSPARGPMRRTDSSPGVTPSSQLAKRRR